MQSHMKYKISCFFFLVFILLSCKNDNQKRLAENQKQVKRNELIFAAIEKSWVFHDAPINTTTEATIASWNELRVFFEELAVKPKKTIGAFQKKSKALSTKVMALNENIPAQFDKPQIKSRVSALITKVRLLDLFLNLDKIPDKKVTVLVSQINSELVSLQRQMDKIVEKSKIPVEEGESELRKMMDTSRAIPNTPTPSTPVDPNLPQIE